ncbi:MAG: ABC transporter substrate-binding protein, partial [Pseudomonadota bacterium]
MRVAAILPLLALAGCAPVAGGDGIVSTNPCADAIMLRLVAPSRIAAISHYSHEPGASSLPLAVARRFRATAGTAEEAIALKPDVVLADSFAPAATLAAYRRAGLRVAVLGSPTTVAASVAQVREVAA